MKFPDLVHAVKPEPHHAMPQASSAHDTFWDFASLMPEIDPHADVGDVGPRHPAQLPHHAGLRRAHLPPGQRAGRVALLQVPLDAAAGHPLAGVGRSGQDLRRRSRLPPARPVGSHRSGQLPRMGTGAAGVHRRAGGRLSLRRARPDQAGAGRTGAAARRSASWCWTAIRTISSPRPSRWRSAPPTSCRASTSPTTRCCKGASTRTSTPRSAAWAGPNFHEIPINSPIAQVHNNQRDGMHRQAIHRGRVNYEPNSLGGGCPFQAGAAGFTSFPEPVAERQGARQAGTVRRPLRARRACS